MQTPINKSDLGQLFNEADRIGDKYLEPEEIEQRDRELTEVRRDIWLTLTDKEIDEL